jgi:hypothetical protein
MANYINFGQRTNHFHSLSRLIPSRIGPHQDSLLDNALFFGLYDDNYSGRSTTTTLTGCF